MELKDIPKNILESDSPFQRFLEILWEVDGEKREILFSYIRQCVEGKVFDGILYFELEVPEPTNGLEITEQDVEAAQRMEFDPYFEPLDSAWLRWHGEWYSFMYTEINKIESFIEKQDKKYIDMDVKPEELSLKHKVIILHYLQKYGRINLDLIHEHATKKSRLLALLFGANYDNVKTILREVTKNEEHLDKRNLSTVLPIFQELGHSDIVSEIEDEIRRL